MCGVASVFAQKRGNRMLCKFWQLWCWSLSLNGGWIALVTLFFLGRFQLDDAGGGTSLQMLHIILDRQESKLQQFWIRAVFLKLWVMIWLVVGCDPMHTRLQCNALCSAAVPYWTPPPKVASGLHCASDPLYWLLWAPECPECLMEVSGKQCLLWVVGRQTILTWRQPPVALKKVSWRYRKHHIMTHHGEWTELWY